MFEKRFNEIKYYERLSGELADSIEIYEGSYQNFEKAVVKGKRGDLTDEQKQITDEFIEFCNREGLGNYDGMNLNRFNGLKRLIQERSSFMQERKKRIDEHLAVLKKLDSLVEKGEISDTVKLDLVRQAEEKYEKGTTKYERYLSNLVVNYIDTEKKKLVKQRAKTCSNVESTSKNNGFGSVILSTLGPIGKPVYNAVATVHNANTKLRNNHKILNTIIKIGLIGLTVAVATTIPFSPLITAVSWSVPAFSTCFFVAHAFNTRKVPFMIKKTTVRGYANDIKDSWFKYRKSHGKGKVATEQPLYQGINFSKYDRAPVVSNETITPQNEVNEILFNNMMFDKVVNIINSDSIENYADLVKRIMDEVQFSDTQKKLIEEKIKQSTIKSATNSSSTEKLNNNVEIQNLTDIMTLLNDLERKKSHHLSVYSCKAIKDAGEYLERIAEILANEDKSQANTEMIDKIKDICRRLDNLYGEEEKKVISSLIDNKQENSDGRQR